MGRRRWCCARRTGHESLRISRCGCWEWRRPPTGWRLDQKPDITTFAAVRAAAAKAYAMAGLGPKDIELAEVHDCFTIAEIIALEDLGFVERGRGGFFSFEGGTRQRWAEAGERLAAG